VACGDNICVESLETMLQLRKESGWQIDGQVSSQSLLVWLFREVSCQVVWL
jgi:hypothetical protein